MADTRDAVAEAIRAHVAAEADGAFLTDWVLIAAAASPDNHAETIYVGECSETPIHSRLGLVHYLRRSYDDMLDGDDDD